MSDRGQRFGPRLVTVDERTIEAREAAAYRKGLARALEVAEEYELHTFGSPPPALIEGANLVRKGIIAAIRAELNPAPLTPEKGPSVSVPHVGGTP